MQERTREHTDIRPEELIKIAHRIAEPYVRSGPVQDSEEFADVCLALVRDGGDFNPEKGSYSTFAYHVGRAAVSKGRKNRGNTSVPTQGNTEGFDAAEECDHFHTLEVDEEFAQVMSASSLSEAEHSALLSVKPFKRHNRFRASHKVQAEAARRQQLIYS